VGFRHIPTASAAVSGSTCPEKCIYPSEVKRLVAVAVAVEGTRDILGWCADQGGDGHGARQVLRVPSKTKNRTPGMARS
jgi:hypothetical protein